MVLQDERSGIDFLDIDSRNLDQPAHAMFIAVKSHSRDGHDYVADAWRKGIRNFLVSRSDFDITPYTGSNFIRVADTVTALQQIAAGHRKQFSIPVIGITGSNGKTIVKEWLYQLLGGKFDAVRSPKSFNSQIGVPLSVWMLQEEHRLGIFEAGISQPGEMARLEKVIQPTIGVFTNIGEAHSEGFMNERQKINEKLLLFRRTDRLVYCRDHASLHACVLQFEQNLRSSDGEGSPSVFSWSLRNEGADVYISKIAKNAGKTTITAWYNDRDMRIVIPFSDDASVENAIHCWCVMLLMGCADDEIARLMLELHPVSMRLELRHGINDCTLINDAYNSDLTSLQLALNYLDQQKQHTSRTVILSDILEVGKRDLYEEVAALMERYQVRRFIAIGPALHKNKAVFRKNRKMRSIFFKSTDNFLQQFHLLTFGNEAILLKGARVFAFEKIAVLLEQKVHQTVMTVDLSAIRHNLDVFRGYLQPGTKTMAMVKAFGYGSGSYEIAGLLQQAGVDYLTVAYTDEGVGLRKAGITSKIMVMSPDVTSFDRMIAWKLEPELYNNRSLSAFVEIASALQVRDYPVHIKLDTGMHRLGFGPDDLESLILKIYNSPEIKIASIFSHLAASDDAGKDDFTRQQAALFERMSSVVTDFLDYIPLRHLCNSAGIMRHASLHYDMVRLGLGLYGVDSSAGNQARLRSISVLKTMIAQLRNVPAGESVGYGHDVILESPARIATICIGYADGLPRSLGRGKAYVQIHGKTARLVGSVCMDMCMVDVTHIPEAVEGDEVIVFGKDPSIMQLAEWAGTIAYEIMTGISQRVKRIYVNEA